MVKSVAGEFSGSRREKSVFALVSDRLIESPLCTRPELVPKVSVHIYWYSTLPRPDSETRMSTAPGSQLARPPPTLT